MKGVLLLSDGIDSPVAGHMMMKQGLELIFLHLKTDNDTQYVKKLARIIDKDAKLIILDHIETLRKIRTNCNTRYQCLLCKRAMYKKAEEIAKKEGARFIVTGENLGQVASQTLENLEVLSQSVEMTLLQPLLGFDKDEIVKKAREIGTYDLSTMKKTKCQFVPKKPLTRARLKDTEREEARWTH